VALEFLELLVVLVHQLIQYNPVVLEFPVVLLNHYILIDLVAL
jgi:hypothetical protein